MKGTILNVLGKRWAVTTGPNSGCDDIVPGRQDINPACQERQHHLWHRPTLGL